MKRETNKERKQRYRAEKQARKAACLLADAIERMVSIAAQEAGFRLRVSRSGDGTNFRHWQFWRLDNLAAQWWPSTGKLKLVDGLGQQTARTGWDAWEAVRKLVV